VKKLKLSKRATKALDILAEAAQYHGWQQDQGTAREAAKAAAAYDAAYMKLHNMLARREARIAELEGINEGLRGQIEALA
jgi:hypothetical protein